MSGAECERGSKNRVSGSGAVSGRPRSGSGAESGCHKNRLER